MTGQLSVSRDSPLSATRLPKGALGLQMLTLHKLYVSLGPQACGGQALYPLSYFFHTIALESGPF